MISLEVGFLIKMPDLITIELTQEDSLLFIEFQKQFSFIKLMQSLGVFDIKNGSVKINFNNTGEIGLVEINKTFRP